MSSVLGTASQASQTTLNSSRCAHSLATLVYPVSDLIELGIACLANENYDALIAVRSERGMPTDHSKPFVGHTLMRLHDRSGQTNLASSIKVRMRWTPDKKIDQI